jgi:hypothetical protein
MFQLADNNITYIIFFKECAGNRDIHTGIESTDLNDAILHPDGHENTLLALMPVPADDTR